MSVESGSESNRIFMNALADGGHGYADRIGVHKRGFFYEVVERWNKAGRHGLSYREFERCLAGVGLS